MDIETALKDAQDELKQGRENLGKLHSDFEQFQAQTEQAINQQTQECLRLEGAIGVLKRIHGELSDAEALRQQIRAGNQSD